MTQAEQLIGYKFKNAGLLETALTHSSFANEQGTESGERLEFLGDSVLGLIISEYLYLKSKEPEGRLTVYKSNMVNKNALSDAIDKSRLFDCIKIGHSLKNKSEKHLEAIKGDLFESIVGAIYLDGGLAPCRKFIFKFLEANRLMETAGDDKSRLQQYAQHKKVKLKYKTKEEEQDFLAEVYLDGCLAGKGRAGTKKQAEKNAAQAALTSLTLKQKVKTKSGV